MEISGFWQTLLVGMVGALISEFIRILGAFRAGTPPAGLAEYIVSLGYVALGGGLVLYGIAERTAIEAATLGAAFPMLFSAAVRATTQPARTSSPPEDEMTSPPEDKSLDAFAAPRALFSHRSVTDYAASRFELPITPSEYEDLS